MLGGGEPPEGGDTFWVGVGGASGTCVGAVLAVDEGVAGLVEVFGGGETGDAAAAGGGFAGAAGLAPPGKTGGLTSLMLAF